MLTLRVVEARNLEPVYVKGRKATANEAELSSFVTIHHGSQSKMTHATREILEPKWDSVVELWDSEMCETLEFVVVIKAFGGFLWKHSMATLNMEQFRAAPETKIEQWLPLGSVTSSRPEAVAKAAEKNFGQLKVVATYTEDCVQPTFLQSLFCNVLFCPLPAAQATHRRLPRAVPRSAAQPLTKPLIAAAL
ncbi:hypothetical protein M885DRAFT_622374 [Pelagophyceae sp. CCMP2097]|nr:hypothetical protein M885DRAFT_622374 [Pelagophyceae sp. CCMP2097]|mmetsp:Transcript_30097/g.101463  ORF Transcript_30097/g.101463 Transcript_30097/m.101463 type:complete len:192 (+) Transcript_30097:30-605(+)